MRVWCGFFLLLLAMTAEPFAARAEVPFPNGQLVLVAGDANGVYHQFSDDLKRLGQMYGFDIIVKPSAGSLDNLMSIVNDDEVNMAFVQADIPSWIAGRLRQSDRPGNNMRKFLVKVRTYYPLYDEMVQIVARQGIRSLTELRGHKVATGAQKSGAFLTMGNIFQQENIQVESIPVSGAEALAKLYAGEVDAVAMVSGYPVVLLQSLENKGYHLLPVVLTHADPVYMPAEIPVNTYVWQKEAVQTVSVKVLLATYDYVQDMPVCQRLIKFSDVLKKNLLWLRTNGHAQWQKVDFEYVDNSGKNFLRSHCLSGY
ncbi:MAG: hypothetical protein HQL87_00640 [Magnetococcales bacterium]|nr:hypothetical protein [Magnetococcales bacterium]